jgi:uncharacterized protein YdaU (DUF1376 family)
MAKRMYMPVWPDAWLLDTGHLTYEQKGIYNDLLQHMWLRDGYLQNDEAFLARLLGMTLGKWRRVSPAIMDLLTVEQNRVTQKRLIAEYNRSIEKIEKLTRSGREGGLAKSLKNKGSGLADATAYATASATADAEATPGETPEQTGGKRSAHYSLLSTPPKKPSVSVGEDTGADETLPWEVNQTKPETNPGYAFEAGIIKLNQKDWDSWLKAYPNINLAGELTSMADWASRLKAEGKNWFTVIPNQLIKLERAGAKQRQEIKLAAEARAKQGVKHTPGQMWI